ncbi:MULTISPECIES: acyl carrier protein [unclassified Streptomyces]|uniref:acyl carrier protein n=1 Tax=unclassified Streptomyces TaxID=2593676 RepID=UPI0004C0309F|nr:MULTISPECIES: acyl carrier protein [unclassified Streptomyces]KOV94559.1 polyketide-8 synthase acyl carrier protein [Streptomyces sp. NRRL B-3648]
MPQTAPVLDLEDLRSTIAEVIDIDIAEVTDTADFKEDLDVDSLLAMEILVTLERKYQVTVNESNLQDVRSLKSVHDLLAAKVAV